MLIVRPASTDGFGCLCCCDIKGGVVQPEEGGRIAKANEDLSLRGEDTLYSRLISYLRRKTLLVMLSKTLYPTMGE